MWLSTSTLRHRNWPIRTKHEYPLASSSLSLHIALFGFSSLSAGTLVILQNLGSLLVAVFSRRLGGRLLVLRPLCTLRTICLNCFPPLHNLCVLNRKLNNQALF